jgi:hypothetical protein
MNLAAHKWIGPLACSRGGLDGSVKWTLLELWGAGTWTLEANQRVSTTREQLAAATGQSLDVIKDHLQRLARLGWIRRTASGWDLAWITPFPVEPATQTPGDLNPREAGDLNPRPGDSSPRPGDLNPRPSLTSSPSLPSGEPSLGRERDPDTEAEQPLVLTPLALVTAVRKPDPIADAIDRILAAQGLAIEAAIAKHGASPRCRLPAAGTGDRAKIEKLIRDRMTKDRPKRTEADCMHVLATYARDWLASPLALQKGWTRGTPWRPDYFGDRLGADLSPARAAKPAARQKRYVDSAVYTGPPLGLPPLLNEPEPPRVEVETDW